MKKKVPAIFVFVTGLSLGFLKQSTVSVLFVRFIMLKRMVESRILKNKQRREFFKKKQKQM